MSIALACYHKLGMASAYYISAPLISKFIKNLEVFYEYFQNIDAEPLGLEYLCLLNILC